MIASAEPMSAVKDPVSEPEPSDDFTAAEPLDLVRSTCGHIDPENAEAYRHLDAEQVRRAVRFNSRLLEAHREYQRIYHISRRGRRKHARAIYRHLDVVPQRYSVIASAWALLPTTLLDALDNGENAAVDQFVG